MARGKYRNARQQDDYYLNDSDLEGRYIDGLTFDDGGKGRADPADVDDEPEDAVDEEGYEDQGYEETVDGDDPDGELDDEGDGVDSGTAGPPPSLRYRLAKAIAPKPPAPRTPLAARTSRAPRTPPARTASSERPARPARQQVVVPEGKTIEDLINNLDTKERAIAFGAAALGVGLAIFIGIYYAHPKPTPKTPQVSSALVAAIVGAPALLTGVAVFIGRRALVGFLALLTGFAMLTIVNPVAGVIFFGVGIWLIMRAQRYTRYAREQSGDTRPRREPRARAGATTSSSRPASKARSTTSGKAGAKTPVASKRYTPPRSSQPGRSRSR